MKERKYKYLVQAIAEMPKRDRHNGYYVEVGLTKKLIKSKRSLEERLLGTTYQH